MKKSNKKDGDPASFEQDLKRLEEIVKELEQGELELERALALYEEGTGLNRKLAERLDEADRRIEILTRCAVDTQPSKVTLADLSAPPAAVEEPPM